jgi:hypothetical protein
MGLNDSAFPAAKAESRFWPDEFLTSLAKTSLGRSLWSTPYESYQAGEEIFAAALGKAKKVTLSFSRHSAEDAAKAILPSPVIASLMALWPKDLKIVEIGEDLAPTDLRDRGELLARLALSRAEPDPALLKLAAGDFPPESLWRSLKSRSLPRDSPRLSKDDVANFLASQKAFVDGPILSSRDLAEYLACSVRFWLSRVLRLSPPMEALEEWPYWEKYSIVKSVLAEFYQPFSLSSPPKNLASLASEENLARIFREIADERAKIVALGRAPLYEREILELRNKLLGWRKRRDPLKENPHILALNWRFGPFPDDKANKVAPGPPAFVGEGKDRCYFTGLIPRVDEIDGEIVLRDFVLKISQKFENPKTPQEEFTFEDYRKIVALAPRRELLIGQLAAASRFKKPTKAVLESLDPIDANPELVIALDPNKFGEFLAKAFAKFKRAEEMPPLTCEGCSYVVFCPVKDKESLSLENDDE